MWRELRDNLFSPPPHRAHKCSRNCLSRLLSFWTSSSRINCKNCTRRNNIKKILDRIGCATTDRQPAIGFLKGIWFFLACVGQDSWLPGQKKNEQPNKLSYVLSYFTKLSKPINLLCVCMYVWFFVDPQMVVFCFLFCRFVEKSSCLILFRWPDFKFMA